MIEKNLKYFFCSYFIFCVFISSEASFASSNSQSVSSDTLSVQKVEEATEFEHNLPNPVMVVPFALLLLMIATGPLFYKHFWEHHYPKVAIALAVFQ